MKINVIAFEGLFSFDRNGSKAAINYLQGRGPKPSRPFFGGYLLHGLLIPMIEREHDFDLAIYPWTTNAEDVSYSRESLNVIVGHSFGGRAAIDMAEFLAVREMQASLMTLDARSLPLGYGRFRAPKGLSSAYNYYQFGLLRGYPVEYAINITLKGVGHGSVPSHPQVLDHLDAKLRGK